LKPLIRARAGAAEEGGAVTQDVVRALKSAALHRLLVAPELGGGGLGLPEAFAVSREIASADASTGWNYTFLLVGPVFGHFLPKAQYTSIYSNVDGAIIGTLAPTTRATRVEGGILVSGKTAYNSAHCLATHVTVGTMLMRDGRPIVQDGRPEARVAVIPKERLRVVRNWDAAGMRATGSDDIEVPEQFVPDEWTFPFPNPPSPWQEGAWANLPLLQSLGPAIAGVVVGSARGCIDAFLELAREKVPLLSTSNLTGQPGAQIALAEAEGLWMAAEATLDAGIRRMWALGEAGTVVTVEDMARARLASVTAVRLARRAAELVADHAGMNAALAGNAIDRAVRDIRTMLQHITMQPARFETVGRVLMGLEPGSPLI
jgi:alkylation response protein AidB-like acyl-CoA dehydrogenase